MALRATGIDLTAETLTLAVCVRIARVDSTLLGFTSHDRGLTVGGEAYVAAGFVPSAVRTEAGPTVDNLEIVGLLDSDAIVEADLRAGLYDGAEIRVFVVDWSNTALAPLKLVKGTLGDVRHGSGQFAAELRSLSQRLGQRVGDLISPLCRVAALGDAQCGVILAGYQTAVTVASVVSDVRFTVMPGGAFGDGYFSYGRITFTSGDNAGLVREIKSHVDSGDEDLTLQQPFPYTVQPGDAATVEAGCDRRLETCRDRFSNVANFRGEPHVPGSDYLMQRGLRT
ncbi:MAG TPA: hypothetical protein DCQ64_24055 [Candidatus Rokubacteria bacterium]|nr:hypothetical protein [Candidatus Rokubacteria bacterium]